MVVLLNLIPPKALRSLTVELNPRALFVGAFWADTYDFQDHSRLFDLWVNVLPAVTVHYQRRRTHQEMIDRHRRRILKVVRREQGP